jgi:hypothetical protein
MRTRHQRRSKRVQSRSPAIKINDNPTRSAVNNPDQPGEGTTIPGMNSLVSAVLRLRTWLNAMGRSVPSWSGRSVGNATR